MCVLDHLRGAYTIYRETGRKFRSCNYNDDKVIRGGCLEVCYVVIGQIYDKLIPLHITSTWHPLRAGEQELEIDTSSLGCLLF